MGSSGRFPFPTLSQLVVVGHSRVAEGAASQEDYGVSHHVAAQFDAHLQLLAQGGACAAAHEGAALFGTQVNHGGLFRLLQWLAPQRSGAPYMAGQQVAVVDWGADDLGWMGPANFQVAWPHALRSAISRLRASAVREDTDASVTYPAGAWSTTAATVRNSGAGYHQSSSVGAQVTVAVPADFPGGTVALGFLTDPSGNGALWTVSVDGQQVGTFDTRNVNGVSNGGARPANGQWTGSVYRLKGLTAGAHTITAIASPVQGTAYFDYWQIEAPTPGLVAVVKDSLPVGYTIFNAWPYTPNDNDIRTMWQTIDGVVAEFDRSVFSVSTDDITQKNPIYFYSDGSHWNDLGHALAGNRIVQTVEAFGNAPQAVQTLVPPKPYFFPLDGTGAYAAYQNGWADSAPGSLASGGYRKNARSGLVTIRGLTTNPTGGQQATTIFTLPAGYRPAAHMDFPTAVYNGSAWVGGGTLRVQADGQVFLVAGGQAGIGTADSINCTFAAEQ